MGILGWTSSFMVKSMRWERFDQDVTFRGPFGVQSANQIAPLWKVSLVFDLLDQVNAGAYQALIMSLEGGKNQLALPNVGRPVPLGTFTGASGTTTMTGAVSAGAYTFTMTNSSYPTKTLVAGDMIGIINGSASNTKQLVMVTTTATSNGSGVITVTVNPQVRNDIASGSTVTLQSPTALFRVQGNSSGWTYEKTTVDSISLDLLEDPRA